MKEILGINNMHGKETSCVVVLLFRNKEFKIWYVISSTSLPVYSNPELRWLHKVF